MELRSCLRDSFGITFMLSAAAILVDHFISSVAHFVLWRLLRRSAPRNDTPEPVIASEAKQSPSARMRNRIYEMGYLGRGGSETRPYNASRNVQCLTLPVGKVTRYLRNDLLVARISTVIALCLIGAIALSPSTATGQDKPGAPVDLQALEKALGSPDPLVA